MKPVMFFLALAFTHSALAAVGGGIEGGNGGDMCEDRIKVIRDDISTWIRAGGAAGLKLPGKVTLAQYTSKMQVQISKASISCTDSEVLIAGAEKTCKNFTDSKGVPQILCNQKRFMSTSDSDQYVLIHHEYAGLSGLEVNMGEDSNYTISNQISEYLTEQTTKKLAVKVATTNSEWTPLPKDFDWNLLWIQMGMAVTDGLRGPGYSCLQLPAKMQLPSQAPKCAAKPDACKTKTPLDANKTMQNLMGDWGDNGQYFVHRNGARTSYMAQGPLNLYDGGVTQIIVMIGPDGKQVTGVKQIEKYTDHYSSNDNMNDPKNFSEKALFIDEIDCDLNAG